MTNTSHAAGVSKCALDLDNTVANLYAGMIEKGRELGFADLPKNWEAITDYANPWPHFLEVLAAVQNDLDFWRGLPLLQRPVRRPACYISARPRIPGMVAASQRWIRLRGLPTAPIYLVASNSGKALLAKHLGLAMIDDSPDAYRALKSAGVPCRLIDRSWNRECPAGKDRIFTL